MKKKPEINWRYSIETKVMMSFGAVILVIMAASLLIYAKAICMSRQLVYDKMNSQAAFYLQTIEAEIGHVRQLQIDFFSDRKLTFLIGKDMNINDYEKRDYLLSVKERINSITGVSGLVKEGVLYLPKSEYLITSSTITHMTEDDRKEMHKYLEYDDGRIHYDGENFIMVETGVSGIQSGSEPNHMLVIFFSIEKIEKILTTLNVSKDGGAFLYFPESDAMIEHNNEIGLGEMLWNLLEKNENGGLQEMQSVKIGENSYFVLIGGEGALGTFVQYVREESVMAEINQFRNMVYILFSLMLLMTFFLGYGIKRLLHQPMEVLLKAFQRVQEGNWIEHIHHHRKDEYKYLYDCFNEMEDKIAQLIDEVYIQTNLVQRAQMKQLQAQIAPHFLFNSFFILSRRVKRHDYDGAEKLAKHLGNYFQYITRNETDYVTLKQEVEHARSYAEIQGIRFAIRISVMFDELPERFENITVPRLILQPLLENAFEHGLEHKLKDGRLFVHFHETEYEYQIYVEDNGDITEEILEELTGALLKGKQGEITGIFNIHRRLQIFYQNNAGIKVKRSELGGACVIVYIGKEGRDESKYTYCR